MMTESEAKLVLSKPLVFGDEDQIHALRLLEKLESLKESGVIREEVECKSCDGTGQVSRSCRACGGTGIADEDA